MNFFETVAEKWNLFVGKVRPILSSVAGVCAKIGSVLGIIWKYILQFRKFLLAIPVALGAIYLAIYNMTALTEVVGINLKADGTFELQIARLVAVFCPVLITLVCLLLMFCSKRTLTPWFVSLFSLAIPLLILLTNIFPA